MGEGIFCLTAPDDGSSSSSLLTSLRHELLTLLLWVGGEGGFLARYFG